MEKGTRTRPPEKRLRSWAELSQHPPCLTRSGTGQLLQLPPSAPPAQVVFRRSFRVSSCQPRRLAQAGFRLICFCTCTCMLEYSTPFLESAMTADATARAPVHLLSHADFRAGC